MLVHWDDKLGANKCKVEENTKLFLLCLELTFQIQ